ncbi:hypothetical protein FOCC_FOCC011029 [Frankliniella occidentalis]|nr:hypothetical protein FOCC_FOCC011029 [Frankliniella occidentalis]
MVSEGLPTSLALATGTVTVPPKLRSSFTIVWGIWFDKKYKPDMNLFLKPFIVPLVKLHKDGGVSWKDPVTRNSLADAPARAAVLKRQEHQAKRLVNYLHLPPTEPGEKRIRRKRRFTFKEEAAMLRSNDRMLACGRVGTSIAPKRGIEGLPVIKDIPSLDLSTCVVAECMHCVLCGVVRQISSLWLFEKGPWCMADHLVEINRFLDQEIHPSDNVSRLPRSFECFAQVKANDFRSFLLYFSPVIVTPYLKDEYHQHWMRFVQAIFFLLLTESISENDLLVGETLLRLFVRDSSQLYGDENYVYNVHKLLYLVLYVRRWGPLWSTSAFTFEDVDGTLASMIHGSKNEGREL